MNEYFSQIAPACCGASNEKCQGQDAPGLNPTTGDITLPLPTQGGHAVCSPECGSVMEDFYTECKPRLTAAISTPRVLDNFVRLCQGMPPAASGGGHRMLTLDSESAANAENLEQVRNSQLHLLYERFVQDTAVAFVVRMPLKPVCCRPSRRNQVLRTSRTSRGPRDLSFQRSTGHLQTLSQDWESANIRKMQTTSEKYYYFRCTESFRAANLLRVAT